MSLVSRFAKTLLHTLLVDQTVDCNLLKLGSAYGGWSIDISDDVTGIPLISAGLGEDGSFDLEYVAKFKSHVTLVDPTDRAEVHFFGILTHCGYQSTRPYSLDGNQPISSYDLSQIESSQLKLVKKALFNFNGHLKLYPPKNPSHVSFSVRKNIIDFRKKKDFIYVEALTLQTLVSDLEFNSEFILKLDIEGAEIAVMKSMIENGIKPRQVLIEYENLRLWSLHKVLEVFRLHKRLKVYGYEMVNLAEGRNATYRIKKLNNS
jgi:FkbM family methyltransferase